MRNIVSKISWIIKKIKVIKYQLFAILAIGSILSVLGIYRAMVSKWLVDAATSADTDEIIRILSIMALLILSEIGLKAVITTVAARCSCMISNSIQQKLYAQIVNTKWMDFLKYHSGDYLTRITSDVEAVSGMVTRSIPTIVSTGILMAGSFIAIMSIDPLLALLIAVMLPVAIVVIRYFSSRMKKMYKESQVVESKYRSFLNESIQNLLVVKSFCLENLYLNKVCSFQKDKLKLVLSRTKLSILGNSSLSVGSWIGFFVVYVWGAFRLSTGLITFGTMMALVQLLGNIQGPFSTLSSLLPQVVNSIASAERLMEIEGLQQDPGGVELNNPNSAGIVFEDVSFSYKKDVQILKNISVTINPGETVALVGASGEGKTTFIHLVLSLIYPKRGHVYIYDGLKKEKASVATRSLISYVPQGNTLFSGTIAENLRAGAPDATDEELEQAAKAACAWEFIKETADGLNTYLGEHGSGLSEGQAQRISIARALLHKTPILILDEATSALDMELEMRVLKGIRQSSPSRTCIVITHRLSALSICSRILRLENGMLKEVNVQDAEAECAAGTE